ncbi:MAG: outer membrane beta-barrel protein [bacterium]
MKRILLAPLALLSTLPVVTGAQAAPTDRARAVPVVRVEPRDGAGDEGRGFVQERRADQKVKKLTDDPGKGEVVPRGRLEATFGVSGADSIPTNPGVTLGITGLVRPVGDFWLGVDLHYRTLTGDDRYRSLYDWSANLQARYYFMLHREANRFVMAYLLAQLGYARLGASGDELETRAQGLNLGVGLGVGTALSPRVYLGVQFKYLFPVWLESCVSWHGDRVCSTDPADFRVSSWHFTLTVSRSF